METAHQPFHQKNSTWSMCDTKSEVRSLESWIGVIIWGCGSTKQERGEGEVM